jgi:hypothetical protein
MHFGSRNFNTLSFKGTTGSTAIARGPKNVLIIFSDLRHNAGELNLEVQTVTPINTFIAKVKEKALIAGLKGVEVQVLGADNAGRDIAYWNRLREFWREYFAESGAQLTQYSVFRNIGDLGFKGMTNNH